MVIKPEAPAILATKLLEAMNLDSNDFLEDYTTDEFKQKAAQGIQQQSQMAQQKMEVENQKAMTEVALAKANVEYTTSQAVNTQTDNARQLAVAIDKHFQEWADLSVKAVKEGAELPPHPSFEEIVMAANNIMRGNNGQVPRDSREEAGQQEVVR